MRQRLGSEGCSIGRLLALGVVEPFQDRRRCDFFRGKTELLTDRTFITIGAHGPTYQGKEAARLECTLLVIFAGH